MKQSLLTNEVRNAKILALRGKKSMGLIALEFGVSRHVVAGIFFRHSHPGQRATGTGRRNDGTRAANCIRVGGKAGRDNPWGIRVALEKIADLCGDKNSRRLRGKCLQIAEAAIALADKNRDKMRRRAKRKGARA